MALSEQLGNPTIRDLLFQMHDIFNQDPELSLNGAYKHFAYLVSEIEYEKARRRVLVTGFYSLDVDWDKVDCTYYHMAYVLMTVERYNHSEYWSQQEFNQERSMLKEEFQMAYEKLLQEQI